jgi:hypothetical protein
MVLCVVLYGWNQGLVSGRDIDKQKTVIVMDGRRWLWQCSSSFQAACVRVFCDFYGRNGEVLAKVYVLMGYRSLMSRNNSSHSLKLKIKIYSALQLKREEKNMFFLLLFKYWRNLLVGDAVTLISIIWLVHPVIWTAQLV